MARTVRVTCMDPDHRLGEPYAVLEPLQPLPPGTTFALAQTAKLTPRRAPKQANSWDIEVLLDGLAEDVPSPFSARLLIHTDHPSEGTLVGSVRGSRKSGTSAR